MRLLETVISIGFITIFHINLATDFLDGKTDPIGPYPRIPDREKLKKQLEQAAEMKKFYLSPSQTVYK
ncbi:hypothetical protein HN011_011987 [Eciton burchellii]|nr:hypothetical protein HN011_011987 [Eciton burchellii]